MSLRMHASSQPSFVTTLITPIAGPFSPPLWMAPRKRGDAGTSSRHAPHPSLRMRSIDSEESRRGGAGGCARQKASADL